MCKTNIEWSIKSNDIRYYLQKLKVSLSTSIEFFDNIEYQTSTNDNWWNTKIGGQADRL